MTSTSLLIGYGGIDMAKAIKINVEFKFTLGQKVYVKIFNRIHVTVIEGARATVSKKGTTVGYVTDEYPKGIPECHVYGTKEEALAALSKDLK